MVNSPIAIYSVVIGAQLYNDIFNILVSFGLLYIPLIVIFFQSIKAYFESPNGSGTSISLNNTIFGLISYILVVLLMVVPLKSLKVTSIGYTPPCSSGATESKFGNTGTTYDTVFKKYEYKDVRLPLLMLFALEGASGFTNAAITMLPCKTDVEKLQGIINTTSLPSSVAGEVERFHNECYARAITKFKENKPDKDTIKTDYDRVIYQKFEDNYKKYGGDADLAWIGSHVLQDIYYPHIYAMEPTKPFPYTLFTDYTLETDLKNLDKERPTFGYPSCNEWWSDKNYGLQGRLVKLAEENAPQNTHLGKYDLVKDVRTWLDSLSEIFSSKSKESAEDVISRTLLSNGVNGGFGKVHDGWVNNDLGSNDSINGIASPLVTAVTSLAGQVGMAKKAAESTVKRYQMTQELPIIQAVLFVLMLSLGSIIMLMGKFQLSVIVSYYFILCSSIFFPFLVRMLNFLEKSLHESMGYGIYSTEQYLTMYNWFTDFYYFVPIAYLMIMSISGVQAGRAMSDVMGSSISGGGSGIIGGMAKSGLRKVTSVVSKGR